MPGAKPRSKFKRKRKGFVGVQKQNIDIARAQNNDSTSTSEPSNLEQVNPLQDSPEKINRSFDKIERNCPLKEKEMGSIMTRKRVFSELGIDSHSSSSAKKPCYANKIIDSGLLQNALNISAICKQCKNPNSKLTLLQDESKRHGLSETLILRCTICGASTSTNTSKKINRAAEINVRSSQSFISSGIGLTAFQKICAMLNLPPPAGKNIQNSNLKNLSTASLEVVNESMRQSAQNVKEFLKVNHPDYSTKDTKTDIFDCSVSVDGTWQKRYGFSSLLGVVYLISIETGEVLDYEVKSKVCYECKARSHWDKNKDKYKTWFAEHKAKCGINHTDSAGEMEKSAAIEMFLRSLDNYKLRYTTFIGDGDSSSFGEVKEALYEKYGDEYPIVKEDCVGHIQKRMGGNMRTFKNKSKGKKLSDGGTVGGRGRLTDSVVDTFQNYYGAAIRNNLGSLELMKAAVWAIYYHSILGSESESLDVQHKYCKISSRYRKQRQKLRFARKKGKSSGKSYQSGAFTTKKVPDKIVGSVAQKGTKRKKRNESKKTPESESIESTVQVCEPQLTFVPDSDVTTIRNSSST